MSRDWLTELPKLDLQVAEQSRKFCTLVSRRLLVCHESGALHNGPTAPRISRIWSPSLNPYLFYEIDAIMSCSPSKTKKKKRIMELSRGKMQMADKDNSVAALGSDSKQQCGLRCNL